MCKQTLGVRRSACNLAVRGELGRYPIILFIWCNVVLYWDRVHRGLKNNIIKAAYTTQSQLSGVNSYNNLVTVVLDNVLFHPTKDSGLYRREVKQKLFEFYDKVYFNELKVVSKLEFYSNIKKNYRRETYLDVIYNKEVRQLFTKLRVSDHNFPIEADRKKNLSRDARICKFCNCVGDEYHVLEHCQKKQLVECRT